MPKCPKCKKEITTLIEDRGQHAYYTVELDEENPCELLSDFNDYGDLIDQKFYCPECDKPLFTTENKAIKFLKSKD